MGGNDAIGILAGILTTCANIPQVIKTYRTRSGEDLSLRMLLTLAAGLAIWVWYGFLQDDLPLTLTNSVAFVLVCILIFFKRRFG
jgi:MtN3 and saliva related transmembrane protein